MKNKIITNKRIGITLFIILFVASFVVADILSQVKVPLPIDLGNNLTINKSIPEREWWKTNFVQYETKTREVEKEVCDEIPVYEKVMEEYTVWDEQLNATKTVQEERENKDKIINVIKKNCKTIRSTETYEQRKVLTDSDYDNWVTIYTNNVKSNYNQTSTENGMYMQQIATLQSQVTSLTQENTKIKNCAKNSKDFAEYKICIAGVTL